MQYEAQLGTTARAAFESLDAPSGSRVNADSLPTIANMTVNGAAVTPATYSAVITQVQNSTPANITGLYEVSFDTSLLAKGDLVEIDISATISGSTEHLIRSFIIKDDPAQSPVLR